MHVRNGAGWEGFIEEEYLKPVVKSLREVNSITVDTTGLANLIFICHKSKKQLEGTKALDYVVWGEKQEYPKRPTCKGHQPNWYDLGNRNIADAFYSIMNGDRHLIIRNTKVYCSDNLGEIYIDKPDISVDLLNSTFFKLFLEMSGRQMTGSIAVVKIQIFEFEQLQILNPELVQRNWRPLNRPILSVFQELGLPKPNRDLSNIRPADVSLDKVLPDRRELDRIVFEAIGLSEEEQLEVYRAVVDLVKNRLVKAKSISGATKKTERTGEKEGSGGQNSMSEKQYSPLERQYSASERQNWTSERQYSASERRNWKSESQDSPSESQDSPSENDTSSPETSDFRLRSGDKGEQKRIEYPDMKSYKGRAVRVTLDEKSKKLGETTVKLLREKRDIIVDSVPPIDLAPEGRNARYEFFMEHMLAALRKGKAYTQNELLRETLKRLRGKDNVRLTESMRAELEPVLKKAVREGKIEKTAWVDEYRKV